MLKFKLIGECILLSVCFLAVKIESFCEFPALMHCNYVADDNCCIMYIFFKRLRTKTSVT